MNNLTRRVEKLEKDLHVQSIAVRTEDGDVIRLRRQNILPLTCAAFRRCYAQITGETMPVSPFDAKLDQLERSGVASTSEPLLEVAADALRKTQEGQ